MIAIVTVYGAHDERDRVQQALMNDPVIGFHPITTRPHWTAPVPRFTVRVDGVTSALVRAAIDRAGGILFPHHGVFTSDAA